MLVLPRKPLHKLTGTDRRTGRQTYVLGGMRLQKSERSIYASSSNLILQFIIVQDYYINVCFLLQIKPVSVVWILKNLLSLFLGKFGFRKNFRGSFLFRLNSKQAGAEVCQAQN